MAKTAQQELKELRQRIRRLEGGTRAEDALPFLRATHETRESFDDVVETDRREKEDANAARAAAYLSANPGSYSKTQDADRLAKDFGISRNAAMGLLSN